MTPLYTAEALATGAGRDGRAVVPGTDLDFNLATPKELGGSGDGVNPEQLFAAGYATCFHSALQLVARSQGVTLNDSAVGARVGIGKDETSFGLAVELEVTIPNLPHAEAQKLADAAHQVCPYSKATRGNIDVTVTVVED